LNPCKGFRHFRQVFESLLSKHTFEKVTFLLLRFLWSGKENEETSYYFEIKYELGDLLKKKEEKKSARNILRFLSYKIIF